MISSRKRIIVLLLVKWDYPGSGKTLVAVALNRIRIEQAQPIINERWQTLVVAPLSTHEDAWMKWFAEMDPKLTVQRVNPKDREALRKALSSDDPPDVAVVHWQGLRLMPWLKDVKWLHIIADECHAMQTRTSQQTTAIKQLSAIFKTAMSGTPVTTQPQKFWSVLNWLYPKDFSSYWKFFGKHVEYEVKLIDGGRRKYYDIQGPKNVDLLHEKIDKFYVRHLKKAKCCEHHPQGVQPFLPDKYYDVVHVELGPKQRKLYNDMKKDMLAWVGPNDDKPIAAPMAIAKLTRLQQFSDAYADVDAAGNVKLIDPSAKLDAVMERLEATDQKVVIFSQYSQMIKLLTARLLKAKIKYVTLTGETPQALRGNLIKDFQDGDAQVFAGTIGAGGIGISLTAASTVWFLDRSYSPAYNWQAEDRCWRIGQTNAVQIVDFIAKQTIDQGKHTQIELKASWLRKLLGDT